MLVVLLEVKKIILGRLCWNRDLLLSKRIRMTSCMGASGSITSTILRSYRKLSISKSNRLGLQRGRRKLRFSEEGRIEERLTERKGCKVKVKT